MICSTDLPKFWPFSAKCWPIFAPNSQICAFSRFFAGLNRGAKSMLQKFKILPRTYFASNKFTESAAQITKFPSKVRNLTENRFLPYYFWRKFEFYVSICPILTIFSPSDPNSRSAQDSVLRFALILLKTPFRKIFIFEFYGKFPKIFVQFFAKIDYLGDICFDNMFFKTCSTEYFD